jgi:Fe-S oxidoreductase
MDQQELRELEARCIQEEAPACTAACPLHVDARTMLKQIKDGNLESALKTYRKSVPFPNILSRICEAPCRQKCRLAEIGDAVNIRPIELFLVSTSELSTLPSMLPKKNKKAALFGSGLDSLSAAYDLRRKGYGITIFEPEDKAGGFLRSIPETLIPVNIIDETFQLLMKMGVEIILSSPKIGTNPIPLSDTGQFLVSGEEFNCVYFSGNLSKKAIDPITRMTDVEGIFSGQAQQEAWTGQTADGRQAALSMDRFMQQVSLTASRADEGSYESRLYTSLKTVEPSKTAIPDNSVIPDEFTAGQEASRCIQCGCMECAKGCEFIRHYEASPRVYIRQIYNNISICTGLRQKNNMINSCSVCGQCESVCPNKLKFQDLIGETRKVMVRTNKMPPSAFDFALRDLAFSNSGNFVLARNPKGVTKSRYAFFPGCQLPASNPSAVEKIYALLLEKFDQSTGLLLRCCGTIADWAGEEEKFRLVHDALIQDVINLGNPDLIVGCPSCMRAFETFYPELKIISLWTVLDQLCPDIQTEISNRTFAVHDPCGARYKTGTQDAVRSLAAKLGVIVEELPLNRDQTSCCSYGGNAWNANKKLSEAAIDARIAENPHDYLTYCSMCRDFFLRRGKNAYHILDLFFDPDRIISGKPMPRPDYSMRHENRIRVKKHLLKKYWSEEMGTLAPYEKIRLFFSDEVRNLMEERMILVEDIQQVIYQTLETGNRMVNSETGHYLTHATPSQVTYWVEYMPKTDGFEIFSAYSHRMFIEEVH